MSIDPLLLREGTSRNGWQPLADALLTMELLRQRVATGRNGFRVFLRFPGPGVLPVITTGCNHGLHKGSILSWRARRSLRRLRRRRRGLARSQALFVGRN